MANYLTPAQFAKTATGKQKGSSYSSYKSWVTKTRKTRGDARSAAQVGSFASGFGQVPQSTLMQTAHALAPADPALAPLSGNQLMTQARGMVNPIFQNAIQAITGQANRTSQLGVNAIQGYNQNYMATLPHIQGQVAEIYNQAKGETAGVNDALANFIRDQGARATTDLAGQATAAGQTGAGAAQLAAVGAGASGATAAYGGSALERLIGQGAAEQAYTAQLPAFAQAGTMQTLGGFLAGQQNTLRDQTQNLTSQLPGQLQNTYQSLLDRELQKTQLRQGQQAKVADYYNQGLDRNVESRALGAQIYQGQQQLGQDQTQFEAQQGLQQQQFELAKAKAGIVSGTGWDKKLQSISSNLIATADQLYNPRTKDGLSAGQGLSYGKIRGRLSAIIKGQFGGKVPPRLLKFYVDQALHSIGWQTPKAGAQINPAFAAALQPNPALADWGQTYNPPQNQGGFALGSYGAPGLWGTSALGG